MVLLAAPQAILAGETAQQDWVALAQAEIAAAAAPAPAGQAQGGAPQLLPVTLTLDYTIVSDYVWRGINFSEYPGEGPERPNHQLGIGAEVDTADLIGGESLGSVGASVWFQWFGGADDAALGGRHDNLQEVDYTLYWTNEFKELATTVTIGWIHYSFPGAGGDAETTNELFIKLTFDDSAAFGTEKPVLNPYIYYGLDMDLADYGSWIELGVEHEFAFADIEGLNEIQALRYMSLTPSVALGIDHRYLHAFAGAGRKSDRLANMEYGLSLDYDVTGALNTPEECGSVTVSGFVKFSDALRDKIINDELYAGITLAYER